jgi:hypothetical protein
MDEQLPETIVTCEWEGLVADETERWVRCCRCFKAREAAAAAALHCGREPAPEVVRKS